MAPAFVPGPAVSPRTTFSGVSLKCSATTNLSTAPVSMSMDKVSRRQALTAAAAFFASASLAPLAASAKGGDSPKISVFGVGGQSSPFTSGIQTGGKVIYKTYGDEELAVFKRIITQSKDRLEGAVDSIKIKSWEDVRSRVRLEAADLRKTQLSLNANVSDSATAAAAEKAYKVFKGDIEALDQAAVQKNQDRAYKAYNASVKSFTKWQEVVGL